MNVVDYFVSDALILCTFYYQPFAVEGLSYDEFAFSEALLK